MKLRTEVSFVILAAAAACSTGTKNAANPGPDAGTETDAGVDVVEEPGPDAAALYGDTVLSSQWKSVTGAPSVTSGSKMDDVYFSSTSVGYAVSGPTESVYKTTDGGKTWTSVFTHAGTYFRSVLFVDEMHGFVSNLGVLSGTPITDTNVLYETTDGGMTWKPVTSITGPMPSGICNQTMIDATHLVAIGRVEGPCFLMTSSDAGMTWTSTDMNKSFQMLIDAHFSSATEGIVVGGSAGGTMYCTIQRTTDGGMTWNQVFQSKTANSLCWKISFPTDQVGYVSVQDTAAGPPSFAKTTDGGQTWTEMPLGTVAGTTYPGIGMGFITEDIGWVSPDDPTLPTLRTSDGGKTWAKDATLESPINRFRFVSPTTAFAIGGTIWRLDVPWTGGDF